LTVHEIIDSGPNTILAGCWARKRLACRRLSVLVQEIMKEA
jgi:hypothetical protein